MSTDIENRGFDCGRIKELLPDYLDDGLQEHICRELEKHLKDCEDCRIFIKTVKTTITLYRQCPRQDVPDEIKIDLRKVLLERHESSRRSQEED